MKFTKLGLIVGIFFWLSERIWSEPSLLWPLLLLTAGGAVVGGAMDFFVQARKQPQKSKLSPRDEIEIKKRAYMKKLKQKKAAEEDPDCF